MVQTSLEEPRPFARRTVRVRTFARNLLSLKLIQRFKYYGVGFILGAGLVYALFGQRTDISCNYFPNARVLSHLRQGTVEYSDSAACKIECMELDSTAMAGFWWYGDVDFRASDPRREPFGRYSIEHADLAIHVLVENRDSISFVLDITGNNVKECDCP